MTAGAEQDLGLETDVPFVDLSVTTGAVRDEVLADVAELLETNAFTNGRQVAEFEEAFAEWVGAAHCVGLASGLDALRLGLLARGVGPGDEVVVPALTFIATFEAVTQTGAEPVVVDIGEADYNMDPAAADAAVGERTRALMPVHLYGQLADLDALAETSRRTGVQILEDACQAHGAERNGRKAGTGGEIAGFSFYPSKNLGAMGDAGALVTSSESVAEAVRSLRQHGEVEKYRSERRGFTARLDTIQAIVLLRKLPHLADWNAQRIAAAAYYTAELAGVGDLQLPPVASGSAPVWHLYVVRTAEPLRLATFLGERGVATARHYPELPHLSRAYGDLGLPRGAFPVAEAVAAEGLSLPIFPGITGSQLEHACDSVRAYFARG